ncbi:MAG: hypothetical protein MJ192_02165 [Clostridia bacterium]|nr:hypothetical protein [Clostridia bacterium]
MNTQPYVFEKRWFMLDFARMRRLHRGEMINLLDILQRSGYNGLGLYVEGAFALPGTRGLPRPGCLTQDDVDFIREACRARGITLFPLTNTVYHMEHFLTQERYAYLRDTGPHERYQLRFDHPDAKAFLMERLHALAAMFGTDFLHVGGDEAVLPPERLPEYAAFVGDLCRTLLDEGITPAVWGDMFYGKPALAPYLPRETVIFDWYYGGHRPDSLRFFREQGFREVIPCPCDDGWSHFINRQQSNQGDPRPVSPDEIEAFLSDGAKAGCTGGLMTHWEDINGHNLWANLVPVVRAGLFMSGRWDPSTPEEAQVEPILFGRVTPYTRITHVLRDTTTAPGRFPWHLPSHAVIHAELALRMLVSPEGRFGTRFEDYERGADAASALLDTWQPANETEDRAKRAMTAVVAAVRASREMIRLAGSRDLWHQAAEEQFADGQNDPDGIFKEDLEQFLLRIDCARRAHKTAADAFLAGIEGTGISDIPVRIQKKLLAMLDELYDRVSAFLTDPGLKDTAIPAWYELVTGWLPTTGGLVT